MVFVGGKLGHLLLLEDDLLGCFGDGLKKHDGIASEFAHGFQLFLAVGTLMLDVLLHFLI
jgi:hypothetical protein